MLNVLTLIPSDSLLSALCEIPLYFSPFQYSYRNAIATKSDGERLVRHKLFPFLQFQSIESIPLVGYTMRNSHFCILLGLPVFNNAIAKSRTLSCPLAMSSLVIV